MASRSRVSALLLRVCQWGRGWGLETRLRLAGCKVVWVIRPWRCGHGVYKFWRLGLTVFQVSGFPVQEFGTCCTLVNVRCPAGSGYRAPSHPDCKPSSN